MHHTTRPSLPVRSDAFFSSLVQTADGRWMFSGTLNGWPALTHMELISITCKVRTRIGRAKIQRFWDKREASGRDAPSFPDGPKVRACAPAVVARCR